MKTKNLKSLWERAFSDVMEEYQEIKATLGSSSCEGFYNGLAREGGRTAMNTRVVRPSVIDFVADVELAARRALHPAEFTFFRQYYINGENLQPERVELYDKTVQQKVGKMLIHRRVHPTSNYYKAKDLR